ncbi:hypothetical protein NF867_03275 [Solitalea sp. MAHUQ-68]|uniref:Transglutaminase-like domain-containing protein n=1 Tax=Solitalea agri TaxID=2953739 RepID=A0A9X2JBV9_9SPHI|nr:transglutaminase domain-containing protein [Solitalea agri]MCO4291879.1 hypothetical protein [Solitalea agri]
MKRSIIKLTNSLSALVIVVALAISACSKSSSDPSDDLTPGPSGNNYPKPKSSQEVSGLLSTAIKSLKTTLILDMSAMNLADNQVEITVGNAYSNVISQDNSLKYAYKVVQIYNQSAKILQCEIKYMPYKLGIDPNTVPTGTKKINSYNDIITATLNAPLGQEIPIAITNKNLDVNTMQQVLSAQCGYAYLIYNFNPDATSITCSSSPMGLPGAPTSISDCLSRIAVVKDSVNRILTRIITPGMTNNQKLTAIYNYVSATQYDWDFNTPNLNYDSQTALGVFKNRKAVCGGYSWGLNLLANAAGIQCYNVSGKAGNVGHAWSMLNYNGGYSYFDATWDNSFTPPRTYRYFAQPEAFFLQNQHAWDNTMINALVAEKQ